MRLLGQTVAILVARMGSTRLPGKSMMPILGQPMAQRMVQRLQRSKRLHRIVLATSDRPEDQPLAALAGQLGIDCYRGSANDVLGRIVGAAERYLAQTVVELLGDNPLVHADLIDAVIDFYAAGDFDYVANATKEYPQAKLMDKFPVGIRAQVYSIQALQKCSREARQPAQREHATTFMIEHPEMFKIGLLQAQGAWAKLNRPELSWAVNYQENLGLIRQMFETCLAQEENFSLIQAMQAYDNLQAVSR